MTSIQQIHYIAGLLEGEGCFLMANSATLQLSMVDRDIVHKIRDIMDSTSKVDAQQKTSTNKIIYSFRLYGSKAIQWMMTLYPLMGERRKAKIKEIINLWKNVKQATSTHCRHGHPLVRFNRDFKYNNDGSRVCIRCKKGHRSL